MTLNNPPLDLLTNDILYRDSGIYRIFYNIDKVYGVIIDHDNKFVYYPTDSMMKVIFDSRLINALQDNLNSRNEGYRYFLPQLAIKLDDNDITDYMLNRQSSEYELFMLKTGQEDESYMVKVSPVFVEMWNTQLKEQARTIFSREEVDALDICIAEYQMAIPYLFRKYFKMEFGPEYGLNMRRMDDFLFSRLTGNPPEFVLDYVKKIWEKYK